MDNLSPQNTSQSQTPIILSKTNPLKIFIFIILALIVILISTYIGVQIGKNQALDLQPKTEKTVFTPTPTSAKIASPTLIMNQNTTAPAPEGYKTVSRGLFSYDYPVGWHVADLWPTDSSGEEYLVMDPSPINTAPRGGPLAKFTFTLINGKPNPDEIFKQRMDKFNDTVYKEIVKETINGNIGTIYHYTAKTIGPMMPDEPVDEYYFTFNKNPSDPLNQQVVIASLFANKDQKITDMFRHIVMSFKLINK